MVSLLNQWRERSNTPEMRLVLLTLAFAVGRLDMLASQSCKQTQSFLYICYLHAIYNYLAVTSGVGICYCSNFCTYVLLCAFQTASCGSSHLGGHIILAAKSSLRLR